MAEIVPNSDLNIRDKTLLKRSVSKHHNNNHTAGYVPIHEQYLHKTGLRGRKTFAFWTLVGLLFILAAGNLVLTITILGVLKMGHGMQSLELDSDSGSIKFFGEADLGHIYKRDGKLEGFSDVPLQISSFQGSIHFNTTEGNELLILNPNSTSFHHVKSFTITTRDPKTLFTTESPNFDSLRNVHHLHTEYVESNRIVSPLREKLLVQGREVHLKGAEGTFVEGKEIFWYADQDMELASLNESIVLKGDGVFVDVKSLPIVDRRGGWKGKREFKVCVCMPSRKLYRVEVLSNPLRQVACDLSDLEGENNPCK